MTITLIKPHKHAGRDYAAGDVIDVPHSVAVWLFEQGIARPPGDGVAGKRPPAARPGKTAPSTDH